MARGSWRTSSRSPGEPSADRAARTRRPGGAVGCDAAATFVYRDERAGRHTLQLIDERVGPPPVDGALQVPVASVVRNDEAVTLQGTDHDAGRRAEAAHVEAGPEAEPRPHRGHRRSDVPAARRAGPPSTMIACRSEPPSMCVSAPNGYGPGSLSSAYV